MTNVGRQRSCLFCQLCPVLQSSGLGVRHQQEVLQGLASASTYLRTLLVAEPAILVITGVIPAELLPLEADRPSKYFVKYAEMSFLTSPTK